VDPLPLPEPPLGDEEFVLAPFAEADLGLLVDYCNDPEIARFTFLPVPYEEHHAREFVGNQRARRERGEALDLSIRDRRGGELLGAVGLRAFRAERASVEVGYWIAPPARGRELAPRSVRAITGWALANLPLRRVDLPLDSRNDASRRVAEKSGFSLTTEHRRLHAKGREWLMDVYSFAPRRAPGRATEKLRQ
jgi:ribosomal-protein-alanine N-acetyltransferase